MAEQLLFNQREASEILGISEGTLSNNKSRLFKPTDFVNIGIKTKLIKRSALERIAGQKFNVRVEDYLEELARQIVSLEYRVGGKK